MPERMARVRRFLLAQRINKQMTNEQITELAIILNKPDFSSKDSDDIDRCMCEAGAEDSTALVLAWKLIEGEPFRVQSGNPDTIARCRSLAQHLGASVRSHKEAGGYTIIIFDPAPRQ
jgi:exoribonuclease R